MNQPVQVIFIYGLANKPSPAQKRPMWLNAHEVERENNPGVRLSSPDIRDDFVYRADLFYEHPSKVPAGNLKSLQSEALGLALLEEVSERLVLNGDSWTAAMMEKYDIKDNDLLATQDCPTPTDNEGFVVERTPLPAAVKNRSMRHFLKEAHEYLFDVDGMRLRIISAEQKCGNNYGHVAGYD